MSPVQKHAPGAPCWFELGTTDQKAANAFYPQLLGWSLQEFPIGEGQTYSMFKLNGKDVAAAYTLMPELLKQGVPPHWLIYFSASDVDATAARVTELGGAVRQPPFDVMEHGRMAVCADPEGSVFALWQAKQHPGVGVFGDPGAVCWVELATRASGQAAGFYSSLFRWELKSSAGMPAYQELYVGEQPMGGVLPMDPGWEGIPSHWGLYFRVQDTDATVAKARELGGAVRHGPFDAPGVGRIAILTDPQGAAFSIIRLDSSTS